MWRCTLPASTPLFDAYPVGAGSKVDGTSRAAAKSLDARGLRMEVVEVLHDFGPLSSDACAATLGYSVLSIRPRFSELKALGVIEDSGQRSTNASGKNAVVWRLREER